MHLTKRDLYLGSGTTGRPSSVKQADDRLRQASELADRCADVMAFHSANFIERYLRGDGHAAIRLIGAGAAQYGFVIKAAARVSDKNADAICGARERYAPWQNLGPEHTAVFPGEVQIMEGAKQIVPSRVWLQVFDDSLVDLTKPLYLFQDGVCLPAGGFQEISFGLPNGEEGTLRLGEVVTGRQSTSKKVQTAADAVNDGPRLGLDKGINRFDVREAVELFSRLGIGIYSDGVSLIFLPPDDAFHKRYVLGYGPVNGSLSV